MQLAQILRIIGEAPASELKLPYWRISIFHLESETSLALRKKLLEYHEKYRIEKGTLEQFRTHLLSLHAYAVEIEMFRY